MTEAAPLSLERAKRAALLLATAQAIGGSVGPIAIGTGGIVGAALLSPADQAYATVPVTTFIVGAAASSIPAALLMRRVGRRIGFMAGAGIGLVGALCATLTILAGSFILFALAMPLLGAANAFAQQYRFAAADASPPDFKPRAISWTLAGGVVTGVVGPQIAIHSQGVFAGSPGAGAFAAMIGLFALAALVLSRLDVPKPAPPVPGSAPARPLLAIVARRRFAVALISAIVSYALMSLVMTAGPLAMIAHDHSHAQSQEAIQWHVIAMFGPSFFTGSLIARFGKSAVATAGLLLIALSSTVALTGTGLFEFYTALILLGLGWNFGFIASTAIAADLYRPEEAFKVQAFNEFTLFGIVAFASFSSGKLLATVGWEAINLLVFPIVGICLMLISADAIAERRLARAGKMPA